MWRTLSSGRSLLEYKYTGKVLSSFHVHSQPNKTFLKHFFVFAECVVTSSGQSFYFKKLELALNSCSLVTPPRPPTRYLYVNSQSNKEFPFFLTMNSLSFYSYYRLCEPIHVLLWIFTGRRGECLLLKVPWRQIISGLKLNGSFLSPYHILL